MHDSTELSREDRRCFSAAVSKRFHRIAIAAPGSLLLVDAEFDVFAPLSGTACSWLDSA